MYLIIMDGFIKDMETGDYAPEVTHSIRRLNEVVRRYEEMYKNAEIESEEESEEEEEEEESEESE